MSDYKNIDQLLDNLDGLLENKREKPKVDLEEIARQYQEKKIREQKGNSRLLTGCFFFGISIFLLTPDTLGRINMTLLGILLILTYFLNNKARKEIEHQDFALSYNDFTEQRKKIALASLKQFQGMRIIFYCGLMIGLGLNVYDYFIDPHYLKLIIYPIMLTLGGLLIIRSIEGGIKEYRELAKAQD